MDDSFILRSRCISSFSAPMSLSSFSDFSSRSFILCTSPTFISLTSRSRFVSRAHAAAYFCLSVFVSSSTFLSSAVSCSISMALRLVLPNTFSLALVPTAVPRDPCDANDDDTEVPGFSLLHSSRFMCDVLYLRLEILYPVVAGLCAGLVLEQLWGSQIIRKYKFDVGIFAGLPLDYGHCLRQLRLLHLVPP